MEMDAELIRPDLARLRSDLAAAVFGRSVVAPARLSMGSPMGSPRATHRVRGREQRNPTPAADWNESGRADIPKLEPAAVESEAPRVGDPNAGRPAEADAAANPRADWMQLLQAVSRSAGAAFGAAPGASSSDTPTPGGSGCGPSPSFGSRTDGAAGPSDDPDWLRSFGRTVGGDAGLGGSPSLASQALGSPGYEAAAEQLALAGQRLLEAAAKISGATAIAILSAE